MQTTVDIRKTEIMKKLEKVFDKRQATVLTEVISDAYSDLVKSGDFNELKGIVKELGVKVGELAEAQKKTEETMNIGFKSLSDQISALGSRWGIYNEATFRSTIRAILSKQKGVKIRSGYYGDREVDVIISDGEHIILEITSRMKFSDIEKLIASGDDYKNKHGVEPILMVATSYISPKLMQKILDLPRKIEVFSYEGEEN